MIRMSCRKKADFPLSAISCLESAIWRELSTNIPSPGQKKARCRLTPVFAGEIPISPALARQRASGYLAREAALFVTAGEPLLILDEQPRWQVPAILRLRGYGNLAEVGPYPWPNLSWPGWEKITCAP